MQNKKGNRKSKKSHSRKKADIKGINHERRLKKQLKEQEQKNHSYTIKIPKKYWKQCQRETCKLMRYAFNKAIRVGAAPEN